MKNNLVKFAHRSVWIVAIAGGLFASWSFAASKDGQKEKDRDMISQSSKGFTRVAKKSIPAVVFINVEKTMSVGGERGNYHGSPYEFYGEDWLRRFFGPQAPQQYKQTGQGSGFIISKDGYILTNNHVIGDTDKIQVRLQDGREFEAKMIGTDPQSEVAVIKIDAGDDLPTIPLGSSGDLEIGEWVIAVGSPFGLSATLTVGVVSAKGRNNIGITDYENFIQTDAAINPGNSGGPLLNIKGEVVGINTAIFSRSGGYMGIGFAIPIDMVKRIKDQLVEKGKVDRGYIGIIIQDVNEDLAASFGLKEPKGILIAQIAQGSAGEKAGLEPGDVILKLNNREVESVARFRNEVAANSPGTMLKLYILRDGKKKDMDIEIGSLEDLHAAAVKAGGAIAGELGLEVEPLSPELARRFGYEEFSGVIISRVTHGSVAQEAGLEPGLLITRVNRRPVESIKEFEHALEGTSETKIALILVTDARTARFVTLPLK